MIALSGPKLKRVDLNGNCDRIVVSMIALSGPKLKLLINLPLQSALVFQ